MNNMEDTTDNLNEFLCNEGTEELNELKLWLFKENIRITNEIKDLEEDKKKFHQEMETLSRSMEMDKGRLQQENLFFDQKMKILHGGFAQLNEDKRKFQKEKDKFKAKKEVYKERQYLDERCEITRMLFAGVNSLLALKKRYKDLIKMFHPDNVAGDHEMILLINREYEELKKDYVIGRQA